MPIIKLPYCTYSCLNLPAYSNQMKKIRVSKTLQDRFLHSSQLSRKTVSKFLVLLFLFDLAEKFIAADFCLFAEKEETLGNISSSNCQKVVPSFYNSIVSDAYLAFLNQMFISAKANFSVLFV